MDLSSFESPMQDKVGLRSLSGGEEADAGPILSGVVGIGASAGGLEALEAFFHHVSPTMGLTFLVVMHLDPGRKSLLASLLQKNTLLKVQEAEDGAPLLPNSVYTIPPNRFLELERGILRLTAPKLPRGFRDPVNSLFLSLAENFGSNAVGLIFSGTGMDGTRGAQGIRKAGGTVVVQSPSEAAFDGMPSSVIQSELASYVGSTEQIAHWLKDRFHNAAQVSLAAEEPKEGRFSPVEDDAFEKIMRIVSKASNTDFSQYRRSTLLRRLRKRLNQSGAKSITEYCDWLAKDGAETEALLNDLLINVTGFFRDPDAFNSLRKKIAPILLEQAERLQRHVRVWVAGCSTGEEAYSVAMLLSEEIDRKKSSARIHIFATDLDQEALETAREGVYSENSLKGLGSARKARFFTKVDGGYQVVRRLRDAIVFAHHNLATDAPLPKMHLITCRNVMIYFEPELQSRVFELFRYSLGSVSSGFLFLGPSEGGSVDAGVWETESKSARIFRLRKEAALQRTGVSRLSLYHGKRKTQSHRLGLSGATEDRNLRLAEKSIAEQVLGAVLPRTYIVTEPDGVLQATYGGGSDMLRLRDGAIATKLKNLLPKDLAHHVSALLHEVSTSENGKGRASNVLLRQNGKESYWEILISKLESPWPPKTCFAVSLFESASAALPALGLGDGESHTTEWYAKRLIQLESEVERAHANLDAMSERLDQASKEYEESHHEMASLNEELQTSAEELETSKEELQSINEELQSVNSELQLKVSQLAQSNDDLNNLLNSSDLAIIFLDSSLSIKRCTRPARELLRLTPADSGRHISHLDGLVDEFDISQKCGEVIDSNSEIRAEFQMRDGRWYTLKITPYRDHDDTISGLTLCLTNISELRTGQQLLHQFRERSSALVKSIPAPILLVNEHRVVIYCNPGRENLALFSESATLGKKLEEIQLPGMKIDAEDLTKLSNQVRRTAKDRIESSQEIRLYRVGGGSLWFEIQTVPCGLSDTLVLFHDISSGKQLEHQLSRAVEAAELSNRAKTDFLATVSHELRTPLNAVLGFAELLSADFQELPDDQKRELLDQISQSGKILLALVNDLLELARIDSGKLSLSLTACDLSKLIRESANLLQTQIRSKGQTLQLELPQSLDLLADAERVKQILINLLGNAIKFTPANETIRVRANVVSSEYVEVAVEDSGPGISEDTRQAVFERFFRGNGLGATSGIEGTGLGLAIVKGLVEAQRGEVRVSCPGINGKGSSFRFTLPLSFK